jgi:hypothetical protein
MADLGKGGNSNIYATGAGYPPLASMELITTEEGDNLYGINSEYGHEDFGYDIAAQSPSMPTSPNGYSYPNATLDAKIALRDWLAYTYGCTNPVGGHVGTPISGGDDIYASSAYCGSAAAASSLSALNTAWGTSYTTWSTSDTNGEAGIKTGGGKAVCTVSGSPYSCCSGSGTGTCSAYSSFGTGTGMLDEDGNDILSSASKSSCSKIMVLNSWAANAQIETDLHNFVAYFAQTYGQKLSAGWEPSNIGGPHPPIFVPIYDGPSYAYAAIAPYADGFWIEPTGNTNFGNLPDLQRIIAASSVTGGKSMPLIIADYSSAQLDSPWSADPAPYTNIASTQGSRGSQIATWWASAIHQQDANNKHVVVGLEHWNYYDQANEKTNLGFVTTDHDNPYDGSADIANGEAQNYGDAITPIANFLNAGICDRSTSPNSPLNRRQ